MSNLFHSYVSGGSNRLWDSVLPTDYQNARDLVVGGMSCGGLLEAHQFNEQDRNLFRDLIRTKNINLPTPTLVIKTPETEKAFLSGGIYYLIFRFCTYNNIVKNKELLGVYDINLVYVPNTINQTENYLSLSFKSQGEDIKISNEGYTVSADPEERGQSYYFELAKIERKDFINLEAGKVVEKLVNMAKSSVYLKQSVINAYAKVG